MKKNRAFLKWALGKFSLVDEIRRYLPTGDCLIKPIVGAGSVFLNTEYDANILSDINSDLINLYNIVKLCIDNFVRDVRIFFTNEFNNPDKFYLLREEFNSSIDIYRRALLFLYLNRHCYNGLCRYNLSGEFNVPFGRYKNLISLRKNDIGFLKNPEMLLLSVRITALQWQSDTRFGGLLQSTLYAFVGDRKFHCLSHQ